MPEESRFRKRFTLTIILVLGLVILLPPQMLEAEGGKGEYLPLELPPNVMNRILQVREHYLERLGYVPRYCATPIIYRMIEEGEYTEDEASQPPTTRAVSLEYSGTHCKIYVDTRVSISTTRINQLGNTFDNQIYPTDIAWFNKGGGITSVNIYIYPIDGGGGTGGFFSPSTPNNIYMDSYDVSWGEEILAHEFQHLIHYREDPNEDIWMNEGCADLAAYVNFGLSASGLRSHLYYFYQLPNNNLLDFYDGYYGIEDYGSAASFMIYLMEKYGGQDFIRDLVHDSRNSVSSITATLAAHGYSVNFWDVFNDWKVALLLDSTSYGDGRYGFTSYNLKVSDGALSGTFSEYPTTYTTPGNLKAYAPYFYKLTSGEENLGLVFDGANNGFDVMMVMLSSGTIRNVVKLPISGDHGEYALEGFGASYDTMYFLPSTTSSGGFTLNVEIRDLTPPTTELLVSPQVPDGENGWYITAPLITLSTEEGAITYYKIDDSAIATYAAPFQMPEGVHTLYYYSVDRYGNTEEMKNVTFKVDLTPPFSSATVIPAQPDGENGWYKTSPQVTFSSEEGAQIYYRINDGNIQWATGPVVVPDGVNVITYWAVDEAGNVEENHTLLLKVDTHPPVLTYVLDPLYPNGKNNYYTVVPEITFEAEEEVEIYYTLDGERTRIYGGPFPIPEGVHTVVAWGVDLAGNRGENITVTVKVDTHPPSVNATFTIEDHEGWFNTTPGIILTSSEEGEIYYSIDGGEPLQYYGVFTVGSGVHEISFWAVDEAGNVGRGENITVRVDKNPDRVKTWVEGEVGNNDWYISEPMVFMTTDMGMADIFYRIDDGPYMLYTGPFTPPEGSHRVYYYSVDQAGNRERERWMEIQVDLTDPLAVVTLSSQSVYTGESVTIYANNSWDNVGVRYYRYDFGDGNSTGWTTQMSKEYQYMRAGEYTVKVEVMDLAGRVSTAATARVVVKEPQKAENRSGVLSNPIYLALILLVAGLAAIGAGAFIYMKRWG